MQMTNYHSKDQGIKRSVHRFDRNSINFPDAWARVLGHALRGRPNSTGWIQRQPSPCHNSRSGKSCAINIRTGKFRCHGCGKSGDIVDYVMMVDHVDFVTACKSLGAWHGGEITRAEQRAQAEEQCRRDRVQHDAALLDRKVHDLRIRYRTELHQLHALQRAASKRLTELQTSDGQENDQAIDECFAALAGLQDRIQEYTAAYAILSFGMVAEAIEFTERPETRDRVLQAVLERGYVHDDYGHRVEIEL